MEVPFLKQKSERKAFHQLPGKFTSLAWPQNHREKKSLKTQHSIDNFLIEINCSTAFVSLVPLKPLTPKSDKNLISPYNIKT